MQSPERFANLPEYAFPRLRALLDVYPPGPAGANAEPVAMSLGEPRHPAPPFLAEALARHVPLYGKYPPNEGAPELLEAIGGWIGRRYGVSLDPMRQVFPLNGTREGLFAAAVALSPEEKQGKKPVILLPNPFYQCYAVAAITAGAEPYYVNATAESGHLPDFAALPAEILERTTAAYLCSPANPQGAVASDEYWAGLIALADRHDFMIFADECYAEVYRGPAPPGALAAAAQAGADPERVVVFHSLSKRSNLPGLRSGFAAGGPKAVAALRQLRSYAGAPLPLPAQLAAAEIWRDEAHVEANRALYAVKYEMADRILGDLPGYVPPAAGFFLWLEVEDGEAAALRLWREHGVRVLPGAYLSRPGSLDGTDPGAGRIRAALVDEPERVERGLRAIRAVLGG
ncbi:MAG: aminotransferase class I/II-fold pyridoxal phosphate-dependent enzyme [Pikeienuella sp.]|uniref:aminotransferase class I/II-fold pyridoxal phosphate-dependent enzyme n=1 Tax=Pikeienuella sp. TaxID=2831957 RepID=UPI00391AA8E8